MSYVTDVDYVRNFQPELAPAWLDHVALISGFRSRLAETPFNWCNLGCGQGGTDVLLAATHPHGQFFGIDLMPTHIDHARRLAADGAVRNVQFFNLDFGAAADLDLPQFDYIVSHGVYSWVDSTAQQQLRSFISRHLKSGGLAYLSYNAMPGRAADISFQYLVRAVAETLPGDSQARAPAAIAKVQQDFAALKPPALDRSFAQFDFKKESSRLPDAYLAHEFLGGNWKPLFVTEVRADMASIGLRPAGSATLIQNYDSFVLRKAAREALNTIEDTNLRELVRDYFIDQRFRRDVFVLGGQRLDEDEQRRRLVETIFCLTQPESSVTYEITTSGGELSFNNVFSKQIVAGLAQGPRRFADIAKGQDNIRNLTSNLLVLCAAKIVRPVEGGNATVDQMNAVLRNRLNGPESLPYIALPYGTALRLEQ